MPTLADLAPGTVLAFRHGRRFTVEAVTACEAPGCHNRRARQACVAAVKLRQVSTGRLLDSDWHVSPSDTLPVLVEVAA